jgi:hypothetical protein
VRFGTLGSETSNHALVLNRYLEAREIQSAAVYLFLEFGAAFEALLSGDIDFVLQVSVNPQHTECVARYINRAFIVDTFIAPSKPLGILTRLDVAKPRSIALQPATRDYADLSAWTEQIEEASTSTVTDGLVAGHYDSGITALELLEEYPGRFRIEYEIGPIQDAWIMFGREPVCHGDILLWPESPVRKLLRTTDN